MGRVFVYENSIQECLLHLSRTKNAIQLRKIKLNKERERDKK